MEEPGILTSRRTRRRRALRSCILLFTGWGVVWFKTKWKNQVKIVELVNAELFDLVPEELAVAQG